jgi:hypothetical protein
MKHKIEIFSAGCPTCKETVDAVKRLAGLEHDIHVHDIHQHEIASRTNQHGIRSLPAVVTDGSSPDVAPGVELTNASYAKLCASEFRHRCASATRGISLTFSSGSIIAVARFAPKG